MTASTLVAWEVSAQKLAEGAWRWLGEVHQQFALDSGAPIDKLDPIRHLKPLSELALAASISLRETPTGRHAARVAPRLVEFAWAQFGAGALLCELQRAAPLDTQALETYAIFRRAGYRHQRFEALLAHLASLRVSSALEVISDRALGVLNAERVIGLPPRWDLAALTARTLLGACPEPWMLDLDSLYAITHTVYHLTDWGAHPSWLPEPLQNYLHQWLPVWLEVYLEAGHWDVVGELLVVDLCLSDPDCPAPAWARLAEAQREDGLLPAEAWRDIRTEKNVARNHYHPGAVAAVAGTLAVARRLEPHRQ
ncbi:MAG: hypothetical protein JO100_14750 [Pseudonocardia sp.]|nr:hypothetical protein [Pseudonocardia sp.]